jgi:hypothetical protein
MPLPLLGLDGLPLAYLGPETTMPLLTVLATISGAIMMFGRHTLSFVKRLWRVVRKSSA